MLNKKNILNIMILGVIILSILITPITVSATADTNSNISKEDLHDVEEFCKNYDIEMSNDPDFINEVRSMIKEKDGNNNTRASKAAKKNRYIPESYYGDIIWTNNPITPFNHVGLYTSANVITEALVSAGVKTRTVGKNMQEFPFTISKVVTKSGGKDRYSLATRKMVSIWGSKQVGKSYDTGFADNKKNTAANNKKMNCSELVWKAWNFTTFINIDSNNGPGVYPNNIKDSGLTKTVRSDL